jgi:protein gp37
MGAKTGIEWTDSTWNPVTGCTRISPGCDNCYAERIAERFRNVTGHPFEAGFDLTLRPNRLKQPISWKKPLHIFVNSMSDLFHKDIPFDYTDKVFETMEEANWHIFQILTKRSSIMRDYFMRRYGRKNPPGHIWAGASIEDSSKVSRVEHVRATHSGIRFLSIEPLIGPIDYLDLSNIDWIIVGGESGPRARPMDPNWVRRIRDFCKDQNTPFFFKQWGGSTAKSGGRVLDGETWDELPSLPADASNDKLQPRRKSRAMGS